MDGSGGALGDLALGGADAVDAVDTVDTVDAADAACVGLVSSAAEGATTAVGDGGRGAVTYQGEATTHVASGTASRSPGDGDGDSDGNGDPLALPGHTGDGVGHASLDALAALVLRDPSQEAAAAVEEAAAAVAAAPPVRVSVTGAGVLATDAATAAALRLPLMQALVLVYRVSSGGHAHKAKPRYVTKHGCLLNWLGVVRAFLLGAPSVCARIVLIMDAATDELADFATTSTQALAGALNAARDDDRRVVLDTYRTQYGNGAASYTHALHVLSTMLPPQRFPPRATAVYMCEDDYLHVRGGLGLLLGGLALAPYATGYAHPDRFLPPGGGGNPLVGGGGEQTRLLRGQERYWVLTNSTTMTYATTLAVLAEDAREHTYFARETPPRDFHMWLALTTTRGRTLVNPLPALCTHGETAWLAPFVNWEAIGKRATERADKLLQAQQQPQQPPPTSLPPLHAA